MVDGGLALFHPSLKLFKKRNITFSSFCFALFLLVCDINRRSKTDDSFEPNMQFEYDKKKHV